MLMTVSSRGILKTLITLGCLGFIVWYFFANSEELAILGDLRLSAVAALLALRLPYLLAHSARYHLVIRKCSGQPLPYVEWFRIYIIGRFLNTFVPRPATSIASTP